MDWIPQIASTLAYSAARTASNQLARQGVGKVLKYWTPGYNRTRHSDLQMKTYKKRYKRPRRYTGKYNRAYGNRRTRYKKKTSRYPRRRKKTWTRRRNLIPMDRRIAKVARQLNSNTGQLTYRERNTSQIVSAVNLQGYNLFEMNKVTQIEGKPLTKLYYYDPSTPGTLLNANFTTGTYSKDIELRAGYQLIIRNNSLGNVHMKAYLCLPLDDTSISAKENWDNIDADNPSSSSSPTYVGSSPTDFRPQLWQYKFMKQKMFKPGASCLLRHYTPAFTYKPALTDVHGLEFQRRNKAFAFLIVSYGDIAHDSVTTSNVGRSASTLDVEYKKYWRVTYSAGVNLKYTYDNNSYSGMTIQNQGNPSVPTLSTGAV